MMNLSLFSFNRLLAGSISIDLNHPQRFQKTTVFAHSFPSSPSPQHFSFVGHLTKLNRPFCLSVSVFFTLEAKFNFLEGHFHYSLSLDNPWKTSEVFGVPNSFPFSAAPANTWKLSFHLCFSCCLLLLLAFLLQRVLT